VEILLTVCDLQILAGNTALFSKYSFFHQLLHTSKDCREITVIGQNVLIIASSSPTSAGKVCSRPLTRNLSDLGQCGAPSAKTKADCCHNLRHHAAQRAEHTHSCRVRVWTLQCSTVRTSSLRLKFDEVQAQSLNTQSLLFSSLFSYSIDLSSPQQIANIIDGYIAQFIHSEIPCSSEALQSLRREKT
jgi:hypothetical protein